MVSSMAASLERQVKMMSDDWTASEIEVVAFAFPSGREETSFSVRDVVRL